MKWFYEINKKSKKFKSKKKRRRKNGKIYNVILTEITKRLEQEMTPSFFYSNVFVMIFFQTKYKLNLSLKEKFN